jgi:SAM-dependent methyltransferase
MSFNPNQLLNNPMAMLNRAVVGAQPDASAAPVPPPEFDPEMYVNAYGRLGMMSIENVVDLGCGAGNFVSVMIARKQRTEMYLGIDNNHQQISVAKAAYPGWKFLYGDFNNERVKMEYDRYGAYLMLNLVDFMPDDLAFLHGMPEGKPLLFSIPKFDKEGSTVWLADGREIHDRYSSFLNIHSIGRYRNPFGETWSMIIASRW